MSIAASRLVLHVKGGEQNNKQHTKPKKVHCDARRAVCRRRDADVPKRCVVPAVNNLEDAGRSIDEVRRVTEAGRLLGRRWRSAENGVPDEECWEDDRDDEWTEVYEHFFQQHYDWLLGNRWK